MTPLAGAPIRLVRALNAFTEIDARLINLNPLAYGQRTYPEDIAFRKNPEEARAHIENADLVHLHHWMDLKKNPFGIDLSRKAVVRQFHSEPEFVAKHARLPVDTVIHDPLPQLVIAQFHERYYPRARMVPNLLDFEDIDRALDSNPTTPHKPRILFSPTSPAAAAASRWNTKGSPETLIVLERLQKQLSVDCEVFQDLPWHEAIKRKSAATAVIDEMVTGSYHLSGLEGLALGKCTFGYLDTRMIEVIVKITGSTSLPWINVHLSQFEETIGHFAHEPALFSESGQYAYRWMRQYWRTEELVKHYTQAYSDVLNGMRDLRTEPLRELTDIVMPNVRWLKLTGQLYG